MRTLHPRCQPSRWSATLRTLPCTSVSHLSYPPPPHFPSSPPSFHPSIVLFGKKFSNHLLSFSSTVPNSALVPFNPSKPPYTEYISGPNSLTFRRDEAVQLASHYAEAGV